MKTANRGRLCLSLLSLCSVGMLLVAPIARADGDEHHGNGNGRGDRDEAAEVRQERAIDLDNRNDENNDADKAGNHEANMVFVTRLVNALNNQVSTLQNDALANDNVDVDDEDDHGDNVDQLRVLTLANLTSNLSSADATTVTNAVNANRAALQAFLANGTAEANAIDSALSLSGVPQASVLAILVTRDDRLLVITA